jgi:hypothetical protein
MELPLTGGAARSVTRSPRPAPASIPATAPTASARRSARSLLALLCLPGLSASPGRSCRGPLTVSPLPDGLKPAGYVPIAVYAFAEVRSSAPSRWATSGSCAVERWTIHHGCARRRISGHGANSRGSSYPRGMRYSRRSRDSGNQQGDHTNVCIHPEIRWRGQHR